MIGVNPADAGRVLKTLLDVWDLAVERMLAAVARQLARGIETEGWAETKAREVLAVRDELRHIIATMAVHLPDQAAAAVVEAYALGEKAAAVLGEPVLATSPSRVAELVARLVAQLRGTVAPVIRAHEDLYQRAVVETELLMQTNTITRREAVAVAVDRLLAEGVDRFEDSAGRRWHLDSYVRMAGRTVAGQAAVEGQLDGMVARGEDLIAISDSPRECALCRPWEGKILSITGATATGTRVGGRVVFGTVAAARAAGVWHPNCTHRGDPFVPGLSEPEPGRPNAEGYREQQQLRALERKARELKRRLTAAKQLGETETARRLRADIRAVGQRIEAHTAATGQLRRRERERPIGG